MSPVTPLTVHQIESMTAACQTLGGGKAAVEVSTQVKDLVTYMFTAIRWSVEKYINDDPMADEQAEKLGRRFARLREALPKLQTCLFEYRAEHSSWRWGDFHIVFMRARTGLQVRCSSRVLFNRLS